MPVIPLTKGMVATVSEEDFPTLARFRWCVSVSNTSRPYSTTPKWYAVRYEWVCRRSCGKQVKRKIYMHREIMQPPGGLVVDHIDGNTLNNCRENLRIATYAENRATSAQDRSDEW